MQYWPILEVKCTDILRIINFINVVIIEKQYTILITFQNVIGSNIEKLWYLYRFLENLFKKCLVMTNNNNERKILHVYISPLQ